MARRFTFPRLSLPKLSTLLTEAWPAYEQLDSDDHLFRRLTQRERDLQPVEQDKMIRLSTHVYQRNAVARRIIDMQIEWVLGEGVQVMPADEKNEALSDVLRRFWEHPQNDWAGSAGDLKFKNYRLYGELCLTVIDTPGTGTLVLGTIESECIDRVITDPGQPDQFIEVIEKANADGHKKRWKVIRYDPRVDGFDADATGYDGLVFYFATNRLSGASRGISDLFVLIDYVDAIDQFIWSQTERVKLSNALVFDVSVKGGDQKAIDDEVKRIKESNIPRPGGVSVHSDSIVWQVLEPKLGATEAEKMVQVLMRMVLGAVGMAEYMFADAGDTNRATAQEQNDPMIRRMTSLQKEWRAVISKILRFQYERARAKDPSLPRLKLEDVVPWRVVMPDLSSKDMAKAGAFVSQAISVVREMEIAGYISTDTGRIVSLTLLKSFGLEINPQDEAEKIAKQPKPDPTSLDYARMPPNAIAEVVKGANAKANETATQGGRDKAK